MTRFDDLQVGNPGKGTALTVVQSDGTSPAVAVQGGGQLLSLRAAAGTELVKVDQAGTLTAPVVSNATGPLLDAATASATYAPIAAAPGSTVALIGNSIDAATGACVKQLSILSNQAFQIVRLAGGSGQTTTQFLAAITADVIAYSPDICVIGDPTNDHSQGIPEATTRANYQAMVDLLRVAGIQPMVRNCAPEDNAGTSAPWNTVAARRAVVQRHNNWLSGWANAQGIPVLDVYSAWVDPATGGYLAGYSSDGTHPTDPANLIAANGIITAGLPQRFNGRPILGAALGEDGNLAPGSPGNGVFIGDTNSDGLANGWNILNQGTATVSLVAGSGGVLGNWQRIATDGSATPTIYADCAGSPFTAGHTYEALCRFKVTSGVGRLRFGTTSGTSSSIDIGPFAAPGLIGIARAQIVYPVGGVNLRFQLAAPTAVATDIQIAQVTIRDLGVL